MRPSCLRCGQKTGQSYFMRPLISEALGQVALLVSNVPKYSKNSYMLCHVLKQTERIFGDGAVLDVFQLIMFLERQQRFEDPLSIMILLLQMKGKKSNSDKNDFQMVRNRLSHQKGSWLAMTSERSTSLVICNYFSLIDKVG